MRTALALSFIISLFTLGVISCAEAQYVINPTNAGAATSANQLSEINGLNSILSAVQSSIPGQTNHNVLIGAVEGNGTAGTADTHVLTVQGIASGVVIPVNVSNSNSNGQATMSASSPVTLASNQSVGDPCTFQAKTNYPISSASGTFQLGPAGASGKRIYVCSLFIVAPSAVSVSLAEGSSSTCGTSNQAAVIGVATNGTAANGVALAANAGWTLGSGVGTVAQTATAANYLCVFQSGTAQLAGNAMIVQQ